jgi:hypothetical protein
MQHTTLAPGIIAPNTIGHEGTTIGGKRDNGFSSAFGFLVAGLCCNIAQLSGGQILLSVRPFYGK